MAGVHVVPEDEKRFRRCFVAHRMIGVGGDTLSLA